MFPPRDHISACICTYKRPQMLARLLDRLQNQITEELFTYSVIVVDNDRNLSAQSTVTFFSENSLVIVNYYNEPEQNIALARNKAIANASGDLIALIDDDEFPNCNWLISLYKTFKQSNADGVLGPVRPHFETEPPRWVVKGKLCDRKTFETGTIMKNVSDMRTGNVLLARRILSHSEGPFDQCFGKTGGEDTDFFRRMIEKGSKFVWCDEACVYETVPPQRLRRGYFLKRALLRGIVNSKGVSLISRGLLKSILAFLLYTPALPVLQLIGHGLFMKYLVKDCDHIGKILGVCGLRVVKERSHEEMGYK